MSVRENLANVEHRVLLQFLPVMRVIDDGFYDDDAFSVAATGQVDIHTSYEFRREAERLALETLAEELVSIGATGVSLYDFFVPTPDQMEAIPQFLRTRVETFRAMDCFGPHEAIFRPIKDELCDRHKEWHGTYWVIKLPELAETCLTFFDYALTDIIVATRHRLAVTFDIRFAIKAIQYLRSLVRSSEARQVCAALAAYFNAYAFERVDSIVVRPEASQEFIARFNQFIDNTVYRELAYSSQLLGERGQASAAIAKIQRGVRRMCQTPVARGLVNTGSRIIGAVTGVPLPEADTLFDFVGDSYMPPVVDCAGVFGRAQKRWRTEADRLASERGLTRKMAD